MSTSREEYFLLPRLKGEGGFDAGFAPLLLFLGILGLRRCCGAMKWSQRSRKPVLVSAQCSIERSWRSSASYLWLIGIDKFMYCLDMTKQLLIYYMLLDLAGRFGIHVRIIGGVQASAKLPM